VVRLKASRRAVIATAVVAALLLVTLAARNLIARGLIEGIVSLATGYQVRIGDERLGTTHAVFFDVHVSKNGDPVLAAQRIDVDYALRDIFPGGRHRYGFAAIAIQRPVLTITRHRDGSLTFTRPGGSPATPPEPSRRAAAPLYFTARVRDGEIRLVDQAPRTPDLAEQRIEDVTIDASVQSDERTTARVAGILVARRATGAPPSRYPLEVRSLIDVPRGIALHTFRAAQLPIRGVLGFLVHSKAVRFDDGIVGGLDVEIYALAPKAGEDFQYRLGGAGHFDGVRVAVTAMAKPIRDLHGPLILTDDALAFGAVDGTLAGMPLRGRGVLYGLLHKPVFQLGIAADGDASQLRTLFPFAKKLPLRGPMRLRTLLASSLNDPLIRTWVQAPHLAYDRYPFQALDGVVDYATGAVVLHGFHARFGSVHITLGGTVLIAKVGDTLGFVVHAAGSGAEFPYTDAVAPDAQVGLTALVGQPPHAGFNARGTLALDGGTTGGATFSLDQHGVGTFGPFAFGRADGSTFRGGFELERPLSASAGWLHLRNYRLAARRAPALPGVRLPMFPPIGGVLDGDVAAAGTPSIFGLAGTVAGRQMQFLGVDIGSGTVRLAGTFRELLLQQIRVDGPLGRFAGNGAVSAGGVAVEGQYDGNLTALERFVPGVGARGAVHGVLRVADADDRLVIQTTGADLRGASVRGIPLEQVAGTMAIQGKAMRLVAADGTVADGHVAAVDLGGPFLVSIPGVRAADLRSTGVPLDAGLLTVFGRADLRAEPRFDGLVAVSGGRAAGYPVSGHAVVDLAGREARIGRGVAAVGSTYGDVDGRVSGIGLGDAYDLQAWVPIGEIAEVARTAHLPVRWLEGSFTAQTHVGGAGARPLIAGTVAASEGSYNGLAFRDASARLFASPAGLRAQDGAITVGSTRAQVSASYAPGAFAFDARSAQANLADFDDYFDAAETLAGTGSVAVAFSSDGRSTTSDGRVALRGLRYRQFSFGTTDATWSSRGGAIGATVALQGPGGNAEASGTIVPAPGDPIAAFQRATYRGSFDAHDVDLPTWLPALGLTTPVFGRVDASGSVAGRWPRLAADVQANLHDGRIAGYSIAAAGLHARSDGRRIVLSDTTVDLGFARLAASGTLGIGARDPLGLAVEADVPDLARALAAIQPKGQRYPVDGALQANVVIAGTRRAPRATVGFALTDAHYASLAIPRLLGSAAFDGKTLDVNDAELTFAKGDILLAGTLPLTLSRTGASPAGRFSFTLGMNGLDLAPFAPFVPGAQTVLAGTLDGRLDLEGTQDAPRIVGTIGLSGGSYRSQFDTAGIRDAVARLAFTGTSIALEALHANVGGGTVDGSGRLDLPFGEAHNRGYAITISARGARIDAPQFGRGTIDGDLSLASGAQRPQLAGTITLHDTSIPFASIYRLAAGTGLRPRTAGGSPFDLAFDLVVDVGKNVAVQSQSPFIDVGLTGGLTVGGTLAAPTLDGTLTATPGGVVSTYNRAFRVQQATVAFDPARGLDPQVDLRAFAHVTNPDPDPTRNAIGSADITITVHGLANDLTTGGGIAFASNPSYSQEQIVGLLLDASVFGAVNFNQQQNGTFLRGAPGENDPLLPPGVTVYQAGQITFNQEAFSILNGQVTERFLAPVERYLIGASGLSDVEVTVNYGGGVGIEVFKQIGQRDIYASAGQTFTQPDRTTLGFTARPDATTAIDLDFFEQSGVPAFLFEQYGASPFYSLVKVQGIQALSGRQGFTFSIVRKYP